MERKGDTEKKKFAGGEKNAGKASKKGRLSWAGRGSEGRRQGGDGDHEGKKKSQGLFKLFWLKESDLQGDLKRSTRKK